MAVEIFPLRVNSQPAIPDAVEIFPFRVNPQPAIPDAVEIFPLRVNPQPATISPSARSTSTPKPSR